MKSHQSAFTVISYRGRLPKGAKERAFLLTDGWNDWFEFSTMFVLVVFDKEGVEHRIGEVKIGQRSMKEKQSSPDLPKEFESLDERFFSLGQDESYYEELNKLGDEKRDELLKALRDVAISLDLFDSVLPERVMERSLLRSVTASTVRNQFHRLTQGGARLSAFRFSYTAPRRVATKSKPVRLEFEVTPESQPPTNIHVVIGRNGVGKTYLLDLMARALTDDSASSKQVGSFAFSEGEDLKNAFGGRTDSSEKFANIVSVSFSAFDSFLPLSESQKLGSHLRYRYIGLKGARQRPGSFAELKSPDSLADEFVESLRACTIGGKAQRWRRAMDMLEVDPLFKQAEASALMSNKSEGDIGQAAEALYKDLSSGHKIVLLTVTRLVEIVEERTLVLLDEPEAHLHPPLLSAFIRSLSDLLFNRNGVAIIATHSPVILQEVPRSCVWKLYRSGTEAQANRPEVETFGENVGVLTREVFGFEVTQAGFHRLIQEAIADGASFEEASSKFQNQLGAEARAILRGLIAERDARSRD